MKRLFLPFERLLPDKSAIEGTGIGLAISQRLVKIMGGAIEVRSQLGEGTTFSVLLPEGTRPNARIEGTSATPIAPAPASDVQHTVLYVEDNPANLQLMEQIAAEHRGVRLVTATKGGEALALARAEKPRLILLDLHLPDIFGDAVLDLMRACAECRDIPIYMVSADAMEGQVARLLAKGANGYITKPINVARMLEIFHQHLTPL
jgi:CheY-like chemotaxis protein